MVATGRNYEDSMAEQHIKHQTICGACDIEKLDVTNMYIFFYIKNLNNLYIHEPQEINRYL